VIFYENEPSPSLNIRKSTAHDLKRVIYFLLFLNYHPFLFKSRLKIGTT